MDKHYELEAFDVNTLRTAKMVIQTETEEDMETSRPMKSAHKWRILSRLRISLR